jgi:hypothetical protein
MEKIQNEEFHNLAYTSPIITVVKSKMAEHGACKGADKKYRILDGNRE